MKKEKKVTYLVQCVYDPEHEFEKVFTIEDGSEERVESEVEAYCAQCDKHVSVTIKGKALPNEEILRKFDNQ